MEQSPVPKDSSDKALPLQTRALPQALRAQPESQPSAASVRTHHAESLGFLMVCRTRKGTALPSLLPLQEATMARSARKRVKAEEWRMLSLAEPHLRDRMRRWKHVRGGRQACELARAIERLRALAPYQCRVLRLQEAPCWWATQVVKHSHQEQGPSVELWGLTP